MTEIIIYGSSDDLIEIEGDINEEFGFASYQDDRDTAYLTFSDGTVLCVFYDDGGIWRITRRAKGTAEYKKEEATNPNTDYSDRVTLKGNVDWVVFGSHGSKMLWKKHGQSIDEII